MTRHRHRITLITAAALLIGPVVTGCGPGWTDQDPGTVGDLKIEIPKSATSFGSEMGTGQDRVHFLMPSNEWRDYVEHYYPGKKLDEQPVRENDGSASPLCFAVLRSGTKLSELTVDDRIQYRNTNKHVFRMVSVTPDCQPGKAYVQWILGRPN